MSTLEIELVKDYITRLKRAKKLMQAKVPPPDMPLQVVSLINDVLEGMNAYLNRGLWPEPTEPEPDFETLENWMIEDGGCEATDGCWVEPDGRCQHGHPSWFVVLGLV